MFHMLKVHAKGAHTVYSGPTLKDFERFGRIGHRATTKLPGCRYERTFMSEPIENHAISKLSTVDLNNHQRKRRRRFRRDRERK